MGSGGVAIAALPTVICLKVPFSDGLGGNFALLVPFLLCFSLLFGSLQGCVNSIHDPDLDAPALPDDPDSLYHILPGKWYILGEMWLDNSGRFFRGLWGDYWSHFTADSLFITTKIYTVHTYPETGESYGEWVLATCKRYAYQFRRPDTLLINDQPFQLLRAEINMVGFRGQLGIVRQENLFQIASLTENVIQVASRVRVPAVLGAETRHAALGKSLVKLVFYRACSEGKHDSAIAITSRASSSACS